MRLMDEQYRSELPPGSVVQGLMRALVVVEVDPVLNRFSLRLGLFRTDLNIPLRT